MLYRLMAIVMFVVLLPLAVNAGITVYPGAKEDKASEVQAMKVARPGTNVQLWTTNASFEKVAAFYRVRYKEYKQPMPISKAMGMQNVKIAFFILDGTPSIDVSKNWMKVQHPWYTNVDFSGGSPKLIGYRNITYIEAIQKTH